MNVVHLWRELTYQRLKREICTGSVDQRDSRAQRVQQEPGWWGRVVVQGVWGQGGEVSSTPLLTPGV